VGEKLQACPELFEGLQVESYRGGSYIRLCKKRIFYKELLILQGEKNYRFFKTSVLYFYFLCDIFKRRTNVLIKSTLKIDKAPKVLVTLKGLDRAAVGFASPRLLA